MPTNIGLNVVEVDGLGAPAIVRAATSVGAFAVRTRRGPSHTAVPVTSFAQFADRFGGHDADASGAYLLQGFFGNGGQRAYVVRVTSTGGPSADTAASRTFDDSRAGGAAPTLTLRAGYRGQQDPGTWGNEVHVRIRPSTAAPATRLRETALAQVRGTAALPATVDLSTPPTVRLRVDGDPTPVEITLAVTDFANAAQATRAEVVEAVNRRVSAVEALLDDNRLVLRSTGLLAASRRDWTSVEVLEAVAPLRLAAAGAQFGARAARTAGGTALASVADLAPGDAVRIADGTRTAAVRLLTVDPRNGAVTWAPDVADFGDFDAAATRFTIAAFDLDIAVGRPDDDDVRERHTGLSMESSSPRNVERVLNDPTTGSRLVVAEVEDSDAGPALDLPVSGEFLALRDGVSGQASARDYVGDASSRTGLHAFDPFDVQLVVTESTDPGVVRGALDYCEARGDCMYVGSVPKAVTGSDGAVAFGQRFQGKKVYGALYGPWIAVLEPLRTATSPTRWIPPAGHVAGVFARTESTRGIAKAPAGDEARLLGALDVEHRLTDAEHTDLVRNGSINGIRVAPGAGIVVDASRTLSTDPRWLYVNVRLLFNYVKSSLRQGLRWVRQEPNRDTLWNAVTYGSVRPFLLGLWREGAFGAGEPDDVFTVVCDATNNPPSEVEQGNFRVEVYFYPSRPAETIVIVVGQQPSGGTAVDS